MWLVALAGFAQRAAAYSDRENQDASTGPSAFTGWPRYVAGAAGGDEVRSTGETQTFQAPSRLPAVVTDGAAMVDDAYAKPGRGLVGKHPNGWLKEAEQPFALKTWRRTPLD